MKKITSCWSSSGNYYLAVFRQFAHRITGTILTAMAVLWAVSGCHSKLGRDSDTPFRIIATDAGFEAPDRVPAGLRHIVYANHGCKIHEAMLVKLPPGRTTADYVSEMRK